MWCAAIASAVTGAAGLARAHADPNTMVYTAPVNDASIHRTDSSNNGPLLAGQGLPDLVKLTLAGWKPSSTSDPYSGQVVASPAADVFRLDVVFNGLVNPPGPLGLSGAAYTPFLFGTNPVYGFIEFDVDGDVNTGGEQPSAAFYRPLGNLARFGCLPADSGADRCAVTQDDLDEPWYQSPSVCLSGEDFSLVMCGCFPVTVVSKSDPAAQTFGPGQTWVVRGRFFQRAGGYKNASAMTGGSDVGLYDAPVNVQFKHDIGTNQTTITLVYALTQRGAGLLAGSNPEPADLRADNQTSIAEGVQELVQVASGGSLNPVSFEYAITQRWAGKSPSSYLDPTEWGVRAIVGTAYSQPTDGLYVYTDCGFDCARRDVSGDGKANMADRQAVANFISRYDGTYMDADHGRNGCVVLYNFGENFCLYDVNNDGKVDESDLALYSTVTCAADYNDDDSVNVSDIFAFLRDWFARTADFDGNGSVDVADIFAFLRAWFARC